MNEPRVYIAPVGPEGTSEVPSFSTVSYADLVRLTDTIEPEEAGTFVMSPRVARWYGFICAEIARELRRAAKRPRRVRTRGHGGRRIGRRRKRVRYGAGPFAAAARTDAEMRTALAYYRRFPR